MVSFFPDRILISAIIFFSFGCNGDSLIHLVSGSSRSLETPRTAFAPAASSAPIFSSPAPPFHAVESKTEEEFSACDPLTPDYCMLPFPNNFWLREDASMPSGYRISLTEETLPKDNKGKPIDPAQWNMSDGFPPFTALMAYFGDVSLNNVPHHWDIRRSLDPDSPTVLMDAETGELLPHFAELNESGREYGQKTFMIWPIERLQDAHRYIVAIRYLERANGAEVQPSEAFGALRDGVPTDNYDIEGRRETFEDIFARLEAVGVAREELQLAWDFNTASQSNITGRLISARDDAFSRIPADGPEYEIESVEDDYSENIFRRIQGRFKAPSYMTSTSPGSSLVLDEQGNAVYQEDSWATFTVLIPRSLVNDRISGPILQYGHGLLGDQGEVESGYLQELANRYGYVLCAANWLGMSSADIVAIVKMVLGDLSDFNIIPDRSTQGMVNALLLMKMMSGAFAYDDAVTFDGISAIDPSQRFYYGNSQGGILGGVYMAVTTDVEYGTLGVPGAPYGLLLPRSEDFGVFFAMFKLRYPELLDQMSLIALIQMLWDRAEPSGYLNAITSNPLPNTPTHRILIQYGLGDSQVSWLGAYGMARSVNAVVHTPYVTEEGEILYGIEEATGPVEGSVMVGYDFGAPAAPRENVPPDGETDTHEKPRRERTAQDQMNSFFRSGIIDAFCDGACDPY